MATRRLELNDKQPTLIASGPCHITTGDEISYGFSADENTLPTILHRSYNEKAINYSGTEFMFAQSFMIGDKIEIVVSDIT